MEQVEGAAAHRGRRRREALDAALKTFLDQITAADARAWFAHCGYGTAPK